MAWLQDGNLQWPLSDFYVRIFYTQGNLKDFFPQLDMEWILCLGNKNDWLGLATSAKITIEWSTITQCSVGTINLYAYIHSLGSRRQVQAVTGVADFYCDRDTSSCRSCRVSWQLDVFPALSYLRGQSVMDLCRVFTPLSNGEGALAPERSMSYFMGESHNNNM